MKVLMINVVCGIRSTGRICADLSAALEARGHEVRIAYGRGEVPDPLRKNGVRIGSAGEVILHGVKSRLADGCGFGSVGATKRFIEWVKEYDPDVIHLHNIHGYYINVKLLFEYLRGCGKRIIWTLHDCWAFTGHASYCEGANCEKWVNGCSNCPKTREYPASLTDRSKENWLRKKALFQGIDHLTIVTPSNWLAGLVGMSFLKEYPVMVINNGINTTTFRCREGRTIRERFGLSGKTVILGVAAIWNRRKGLDDCIALAERLDPQRFGMILIGLDKKQIGRLPPAIVGIPKTDSPEELALYYSAADVFFNPTYEDNYPTTNLEAIACGTPVITYKTGGSPESASLYGVAVEKGDLDSVCRLLGDLSSLHEVDADLSAEAAVGKYLQLYG